MIESHLWSLIVAIPVLLVTKWMAQSIPYKKQGFFCEDLEIRLPLYSDTVDINDMYMAFVIISIVMITAVEYTLIRSLTRLERRVIVRKAKYLHPGIQNILYFLLALTCSILTTSTILELGKRATSRIRPNFLAVCQPNLKELCPPNSYRYVENYTCYGKYYDDQFFSFPSGHSCQAVNFAVFFIYYLQKRCKLHQPIRAFLQFFLFLAALFICLSRIRDCKHRLSDVAGGALIGCGTGFFYINFVLHHYRLNRYKLGDLPKKHLAENASQNLKSHNQNHPTLITIPETYTNQHSSDYGSINNSSSENIFEKSIMG